MWAFFHHIRCLRHPVGCPYIHTRTYRPNAMQSRYRYDADGRLRDLRHHQGDETLAQFQYEVDANGNRTEAREFLMPASAGNATQTYAYNHPDISFPHGTWVDEGHFKVADGWASWLKVRLVANSISFTYGTGPDHSLFDVYVGSSLWQSVDGYATERGEATLTIPLRYDGPLDFEIRNREEKNLQSTGYVVRFKQVQATSKLSTHKIAYSYDGLARLLLADYGATQYQYGFDVAGNLVNNNGVTNTFNSANQLIGSGTDTFEYDNNGNLWKTNGAISHTWDRANRLLSHGGLSYAYDGMGNRVSQDNGTNVTNYLLDVQPALAKVIGANQERYSHDMYGVHTTRTNANERYWSLPDGLGSIRAETSIAGEIVGAQNFDPYGVVQNVSGNLSHDFAFTGEPLDGNGLQYHRARYMNPNIGGFLSLDPFEGVHRRPMSLNGYSWVEGNPIMHTDASGKVIGLGAVAALGVGGLVKLGLALGALVLTTIHLTNTLSNLDTEDIEDMLKALGSMCVASLKFALTTAPYTPQVVDPVDAAQSLVTDAYNLPGTGDYSVPITGAYTPAQSQSSEEDEVLPFDFPLDPPDQNAEPVYRLGNYNARNLTPRPHRDVPSGLSLTTTSPMERAVKFSGGIPHLIAIGFIVEPAPSLRDPGHILLKPGIMHTTLGYNLEEWAKTRESIDNSKVQTWYPLTLALYTIGEKFSP